MQDNAYYKIAKPEQQRYISLAVRQIKICQHRVSQGPPPKIFACSSGDVASGSATYHFITFTGLFVIFLIC
jgi:hypothetical protein